MTEQDQIKALAELDGWTNLCVCSVGISIVVGWRPDKVFNTSSPNDFNEPVPGYLHSYDAIIPLIQKQDNEIIIETLKHLDVQFFDGWYWRQLVALIKQTPAQLCEALLRATNKWKE